MLAGLECMMNSNFDREQVCFAADVFRDELDPCPCILNLQTPGDKSVDVLLDEIELQFVI